MFWSNLTSIPSPPTSHQFFSNHFSIPASCAIFKNPLCPLSDILCVPGSSTICWSMVAFRDHHILEENWLSFSQQPSAQLVTRLHAEILTKFPLYSSCECSYLPCELCAMDLSCATNTVLLKTSTMPVSASLAVTSSKTSPESWWEGSAQHLKS